MKVRFPFCSLSHRTESPPPLTGQLTGTKQKSLDIVQTRFMSHETLSLKPLEGRNHASSNLHICTHLVPIFSMGKCQQKPMLLLFFWRRSPGRVRMKAPPVIKSVGQFCPCEQIKARLLFNSLKTLSLKFGTHSSWREDIWVNDLLQKNVLCTLKLGAMRKPQ